MPKIAQLIYFIRLLLAVIFWGGIFWCLPTAPHLGQKVPPLGGALLILKVRPFRKSAPPLKNPVGNPALEKCGTFSKKSLKNAEK